MIVVNMFSIVWYDVSVAVAVLFS